MEQNELEKLKFGATKSAPKKIWVRGFNIGKEGYDQCEFLKTQGFNISKIVRAGIYSVYQLAGGIQKKEELK